MINWFVKYGNSFLSEKYGIFEMIEIFIDFTASNTFRYEAA